MFPTTCEKYLSMHQQCNSNTCCFASCLYKIQINALYQGWAWVGVQPEERVISAGATNATFAYTYVTSDAVRFVRRQWCERHRLQRASQPEAQRGPRAPLISPDARRQSRRLVRWDGQLSSRLGPGAGSGRSALDTTGPTVGGDGECSLCRVVSCRVVSCRVVSCRVVSCRVVSCRVVSGRVGSGRVVSCLVVSGRVWSCLVVSGRVVSCRVVSCRVVSCRVVSCRVVSCRVVSCRVVSCRVVSCRAVPCRAVSSCVATVWSCYIEHTTSIIIGQIHPQTFICQKRGEHYAMYVRPWHVDTGVTTRSLRLATANLPPGRQARRTGADDHRRYADTTRQAEGGFLSLHG